MFGKGWLIGVYRPGVFVLAGLVLVTFAAGEAVGED